MNMKSNTYHTILIILSTLLFLLHLFSFYKEYYLEIKDKHIKLDVQSNVGVSSISSVMS